MMTTFSCVCYATQNMITRTKRGNKQLNMDLHTCNLKIAIHSLQKVDESKLLLENDFLLFDSHKQPLPISDHKLFSFWVVTLMKCLTVIIINNTLYM